MSFITTQKLYKSIMSIILFIQTIYKQPEMLTQTSPKVILLTKFPIQYLVLSYSLPKCLAYHRNSKKY